MTPQPLTAADLAARHGFFTRQGGVSDGGYASLNCALSGGDDPARVRENRARAMAALDLPATALHGVRQVHGTAVVVVGADWTEGQTADALVTARPGVALGIVTADCAPVLFADPVAGVIGAAHAGWRGAVAGVLEATVAAMTALGADPARIAAVVGPCIAQPSYEVGPDLRAAVLAEDEAHARFLAPGRRADRWQFDLRGTCEARLRAAGLTRVAVLAADTLTDPERFFSHRRRTLGGEGAIGHQLSAIALG